MGRIKTSFVKHVSKELMEKYGDKFSDDFEKNKEVLKQFASFESTRMRNTVAGYISSLKKQKF